MRLIFNKNVRKLIEFIHLLMENSFKSKKIRESSREIGKKVEHNHTQHSFSTCNNYTNHLRNEIATENERHSTNSTLNWI